MPTFADLGPPPRLQRTLGKKLLLFGSPPLYGHVSKNQSIIKMEFVTAHIYCDPRVQPISVKETHSANNQWNCWNKGNMKPIKLSKPEGLVPLRPMDKVGFRSDKH